MRSYLIKESWVITTIWRTTIWCKLLISHTILFLSLGFKMGHEHSSFRTVSRVCSQLNRFKVIAACRLLKPGDWIWSTSICTPQVFSEWLLFASIYATSFWKPKRFNVSSGLFEVTISYFAIVSEHTSGNVFRFLRDRTNCSFPLFPSFYANLQSLSHCAFAMWIKFLWQ